MIVNMLLWIVLAVAVFAWCSWVWQSFNEHDEFVIVWLNRRAHLPLWFVFLTSSIVIGVTIALLAYVK